MSDLSKLDLLVKQYQSFTKSNKNIMKMIISEEAKEEWVDNYHLIDNSWIQKWKEIIKYDILVKEIKDDDNYQSIYSFIEKSIEPKILEELNNKEIYYDIKDKYIIDSTKDFILITDEAWSLFDEKKKNLKYNGKVSILIGLKKLLIKFDENNYLVKYFRSTNDSGEFIIIFNPAENDYKKEILDDISKKDISQWMEEVKFNYILPIFTLNNYKVPFDIKQKSDNFYRVRISNNLSEIDFNEASQFISSSKSNFSCSSIIPNINSKKSSLSSEELSSFLSDAKNLRYVKKYKNTSNVCAVMRCLSFIEPLAEYFMSTIKNYKIFSKFIGITNFIREYFLKIWTFDSNPFEPNALIDEIKEEANINVDEEQDPIKFLEFVINSINKYLNGYENLDIDFYEIKELLKNETYFDELNRIIHNNSSIIGKYFLGLLLEIYHCEKCKTEKKKIIEFKIMNLDYISIINELSQPGNIITKLDIDFLLEYFFLKKGKSLVDYYENCPKCNKKIKISKREILKYPQYLIIRLARGKFEEKKGFINNKFTKINNKIVPFECETIKKNIKRYYSNQTKKYNCEYNLISRINYEDENGSIKFKSFCKSPISSSSSTSSTKNEWISFDFDSPPKKELNTSKKSNKSKDQKDNNNSEPYILFYEFKINP